MPNHSLTVALLMGVVALGAAPATLPSLRMAPARGDSSPARPGIAVPLLGFAAASAGGLRPVLGIPGAAALGPPVAGLDAAILSFSPDRHYALIQSAGDSGLHVALSDRSSVTGLQAVPGNWPKIDLLALSPSGTAAAAFSGEQRKVQVIAGLPGDAHLVRELDLAQSGGSSRALAVSDDAQLVLIGSSDGNTGSIAVFDGGSAAGRIPAGDPSAIRFIGQTGNAIFADRAWKEVVLLERVQGGFAVRRLAGAADGIDSPSDLDLSAGGTQAVVANPASGNIAVVDLRSSNLAVLPGAAGAGRVHRLDGNARFLLASPEGGRCWLLDLSGPAPRLWRLPVLNAETGKRGESVR